MSQPRSSGKFSRLPLADRFWAKVVKTDSCWLWVGAKGERGYGRIWSNGKTTAAAREAWELAYGPISTGLYALHHCDNPPCVRPSHLFLGDYSENQFDCLRKGRHPNAKVTLLMAAEIRRLYATGKWSYPSLGRRFGITFQLIGKIVKGKTWHSHPAIQRGIKESP